MSRLLDGVYALCTFAVFTSFVLLLLPQNRLSESVRRGCRLLLIALAIPVAFSVFEFDWSSVSGGDVSSVPDAREYISNRLAQPLCDEVEEQVAQILGQFGITGGQIRIDCKKGAFGDLELEHIGVFIPPEFGEKQAALKRLLLKKFDVFCDVSVEEIGHDPG